MDFLTSQKLYDKAPEVLSRFAQDLFDYSENFESEKGQKISEENDENNESNKNHKLMLEKVEFLFQISQSKEDTDLAVKTAIKWAKSAIECRKDRGKASFEIG
uniref:Uncharacterized protein n=1 Tax=Panagrolaimus superbus TaxID=310955 RepID=A0A914Y2Z7_9BILA